VPRCSATLPLHLGQQELIGGASSMVVERENSLVRKAAGDHNAGDKSGATTMSPNIWRCEIPIRDVRDLLGAANTEGQRILLEGFQTIFRQITGAVQFWALCSLPGSASEGSKIAVHLADGV
jgi:hypothetical protein